MSISCISWRSFRLRWAMLSNLRDLDGLTTSEAAQILGVADVTVKLMYHGRAKLRRLIGQALDAKPRFKPTRIALTVVARK
jgi:hypothetical protein